MSHLPGAVRVDPDSQHSLESLKIPSNSRGRLGLPYNFRNWSQKVSGTSSFWVGVVLFILARHISFQLLKLKLNYIGCMVFSSNRYHAKSCCHIASHLFCDCLYPLCMDSNKFYLQCILCK